ncbi:MAG: rod-determining factor RdfA [Salinigranum sp.]
MVMDQELMPDGGTTRTSRSKVARVIDKYGLNDLDNELVSLWTGEGTERYSLRELETYVNQRILRAAMQEADMNPLMGEVENLYDLLTDDETSEGVRLEACKRLEREGVDVDAIRDDFVSHQSIHTYLKQHLEVSYDRSESDEDRIERANGTILSLQNRTEAVTEGTLRNLRNADVLDLDGFEVFVDIRVACDDCGRYYEINELLERRGCECHQNA